MNEDKLKYLLQFEEQEFLDFKQEHYENNAKFIHDLLCLSNAEHNGDRYIILGIEDKTKKIIGVENDTNRKNLQNFTDIIRAANFNNQPTIKLETILIENHEIDILTIRNKKKRPYFLLKDYYEGKTKVRAGVVYMRDGDSNTPIDSTAEPLKIVATWREYFGLDLTPFERFKLYLKDYNMWSKQPVSISGDKECYYHKQYPEYTIQVLEEEDSYQNIDWYSYKPAHKQNIRLLYLNTILDEKYFYFLIKEECFFPVLDSSRYYINELYPEKLKELSSANWIFENEIYFTLRDNLSYEIYELFKVLYKFKTIEEFASSCWAKMPIYVFNDLEEAKIKIKEIGLGKIGK